VNGFLLWQFIPEACIEANILAFGHEALPKIYKVGP